MQIRRVFVTFVILTVMMIASVILFGCGVISSIDQAFEKIEDTPTRELPVEDDTEPVIPIDDLSVEGQMERLEQQVIEYRGLDSVGDIDRVFFSKDDLRVRMEADFNEDYTAEDAAIDNVFYEIIGLVEPGTDILEIYVDMYSENVAGFYDFKTREMVIVQGGDFTGLEHMTYAHEFTHALQDMNYDMDDGLKYGTDYCEGESERCAALQALIEGDASLSELIWYTDYATRQEAQEIFAGISEMDLDPFAGYPPFMEDSLYFPYLQGLSFVQFFHDEGGWDAVDTLYQNPPMSTEQILHPEKYPDDLPITVDLEDLSEELGFGWEIAYEDVMGEWFTYLLLNAPVNPFHSINEEDASTASNGWGGDAFRLYLNDSDDYAFQLKYVWDSQNDADEFFEIFAGYLDLRFGEPVNETNNSVNWETNTHDIVLTISGGTTEWRIIPLDSVKE